MPPAEPEGDGRAVTLAPSRRNCRERAPTPSGSALAHGGTLFAQTEAMSNAGKRTEGKGEEIGGKIKAGVGKLIGNEQMQAEGQAHAAKGKAKQEAAKGAERAKGKIQEAVGSAKGALGDALDNEQMEAEGRAKKLEGQARQAANRK